MERIRTVIAYKDYFRDFLLEQSQKVQDKIFKIIEIIEFQQRIPEKYLKQIEGTKGLYEARIKLGSDIWRVFFLFRPRKVGNPVKWVSEKDPKDSKVGN